MRRQSAQNDKVKDIEKLNALADKALETKRSSVASSKFTSKYDRTDRGMKIHLKSTGQSKLAVEIANKCLAGYRKRLIQGAKVTPLWCHLHLGRYSDISLTFIVEMTVHPPTEPAEKIVVHGWIANDGRIGGSAVRNYERMTTPFQVISGGIDAFIAHNFGELPYTRM